MSNYRYEDFDEGKKVVLNELTDEYKQLLINNIMDENNYNTLQSINIRDIINMDNRLKNIMLKKKSQRKKDKITKLMLYMGILYSVIGILFYFTTSRKIILDTNEEIAVIITVAGLLVIMISFLYKDLSLSNLRNAKADSRNERTFVDSFEIVQKWSEIEGIAYKITKYDSMENKYVPLRKVIDEMTTKNFITEDDKQKIKGILSVRNSVVHNRENKMTNNDTLKKMTEADEIIEKLKIVLDKK